MSDEPKLSIEVYRDGAAPAVRAVGQALEKTVRTALRTVDAVLWPVNYAFDWLGSAVTRRLEAAGVDESEVLPPDPVVEARILNELQAVGPLEDPALRELLAGLLAMSMTQKGQAAGHPLYLGTLRQLTAVEARIVCLLAGAAENKALIQVQLSDAGHIGFPKGPVAYSQEDVAGLEADVDLWPLSTGLSIRPQLVEASIAHLTHLGVVELETSRSAEECRPGSASALVDEAFRQFKERNGFEPTRDHDDIDFCIPDVTVFVGVSARSVHLSQWGKGFAEACDASAVWRELK